MNNYVAKHMAKVNRPSVEIDKKKEEKATGSYLNEEMPTNGMVNVVDTPQEEE